MRLLMITLLPALLGLSAATAQTGSFNSYTKPCNNAATLSITGLPKLGTTFTVHNILTPGACTKKFCGCNPGKCNTCQGSILVFGVNKINLPLGACNLHVDPLLLIGGTGNVAVAVPNSAALFGFKFLLQRADTAFDEVIDTNCGTSYVVSRVNSFSDGVEGTVGL
jgi:hypothetical protein